MPRGKRALLWALYRVAKLFRMPVTIRCEQMTGGLVAVLLAMNEESAMAVGVMANQNFEDHQPESIKMRRQLDRMRARKGPSTWTH